MREDLKTSRALKLAGEMKDDLAVVAAGFEAWRCTWRSMQETDGDRVKWDHYQKAFITNSPDWGFLVTNGYDVASHLLDRCLGHVGGHPGPVAVVSFKYAVRTLVLRPDLVRGKPGDGSLIVRVQGLVKDHAVPDGIAAERWRKLVALGIRTLMDVGEIRDEYAQVARMMHRSESHPLRAGFFEAVEIATQLIAKRKVHPLALGRLHTTRTHLTRRLSAAA